MYGLQKSYVLQKMNTWLYELIAKTVSFTIREGVTKTVRQPKLNALQKAYAL